MRTVIAICAIAMLGACATVPSARSMPDGAWVLAQWSDGEYYPGVLQGRQSGAYHVAFDDGTEASLSVRQIRPYDWQIGTAIACEITEGEMTTVTISTMGPETTSLGVTNEAGVRTETRTGRCRAL
ncbi:MAG: hypothetical protein JWR59_272 [Brevundimonas sp.]|nr:hypothetical protein [Brevundimonas sp.]